MKYRFFSTFAAISLVLFAGAASMEPASARPRITVTNSGGATFNFGPGAEADVRAFDNRSTSVCLDPRSNVDFSTDGAGVHYIPDCNGGSQVASPRATMYGPNPDGVYVDGVRSSTIWMEPRPSLRE